jgi:hypothetical protein
LIIERAGGLTGLGGGQTVGYTEVGGLTPFHGSLTMRGQQPKNSFFQVIPQRFLGDSNSQYTFKN